MASSPDDVLDIEVAPVRLIVLLGCRHRIVFLDVREYLVACDLMLPERKCAEVVLAQEGIGLLEPLVLEVVAVDIAKRCCKHAQSLQTDALPPIMHPKAAFQAPRA